MKLVLSIKDGKAIATEGTHKNEANKILKDYIVKDYFMGDSLYSNQQSYFLITNDDRVLEIPIFDPIDKNKIDITSRTYKKMVIDKVFGNEVRIICKEEKLEELNITRKINDNEYWIKSDNKEIHDIYTKARIIDKINSNKKEIEKCNKINEILEYLKDNIKADKDHFYLFERLLTFKKNNIKVGELSLKYCMSIDEIEQRVKKYIIKESV